MNRTIFGFLLFFFASTAAEATVLSPDILFTVRDETADGTPDSFIDGSTPAVPGLITNEDFVDETFFEFAVGSAGVSSATLNLGLVLYDEFDVDKTVDISSYANGNGSGRLDLFGTGDYLATLSVQEFFTLNSYLLDISGLYNAAVTAGDDFLGFRLHNVIDLNGGIRQAKYVDASLQLGEVPLPASLWLFATALAGFTASGRRRRSEPERISPG